MADYRFMQGNEAITEGAIAAGARFFAGYPITPSTEIAETSSIRLPQVGGMYVQMEDEIGSIAAVIGAACSGKKSFSATSGPGLSLMSENLGVAVLDEIPCVIIDVQRFGPSTGMATKPSQGDVNLARWGTHGEHAIIALSPSSVQDCYDYMITAFNYAELYRTPVIFLTDELIGHLKENVIIRAPGEIAVAEREKPDCDSDAYKPHDFTNTFTPLASFGSEFVFKINSSMHDEYGRPCADYENAGRAIEHINNKIETNKEKIAITREYGMDNAEYVIIAYGGVTRAAISAMAKAREQGIRVGVLQLITLWPVAEKKIVEVLSRVKAAIVPELNMGQYRVQIERLNFKNIPVLGVNRVDGKAIEPVQIVTELKEVVG